MSATTQHEAEFSRHWARCARYLEPALDGNFTLDDVRELVTEPHIQFWPLAHSAVVTEILAYPLRRVCRVWLAGGDLDELRRFLPALDNYARSEGCSRIEIDGRRGWRRVLKDYHLERVTLAKDIE